MKNQAFKYLHLFYDNIYKKYKKVKFICLVYIISAETLD